MKTLRNLVAAFIAVSLISATVFAIDPVGTWKWSLPPTGAAPVEVTLSIEVSNGALTGTYTETGKDALPVFVRVSGDTLSFTVAGTSLGKVQYIGRLEGDIIDGLIEVVDQSGEAGENFDWRATRSK